MPCIYFCESGSANHAVLRAILSEQQINEPPLLRDSVFLGEKFPTIWGKESEDFALLKIDDHESVNRGNPACTEFNAP